MRDEELDKEFVYFLSAYYFHWTPVQVDAVEYPLLASLMAILPPFLKKINEVKADG